MTDFPVTNLAGITTALGSAVAGDTITCAAGNYGDLDIDEDFGASGQVTIRSASADNKARFASIFVDTTGQGIRLENLHVEGTNTYGIQLRGKNTTCFRCVLSGFTNTFQVEGADGFELLECQILHSGVDGIRLTGAKNGLIQDCIHFGSFGLAEGPHYDFLQARNGCSDIIVDGCVFICRTRTNVQGVFFGTAVVHSNITVKNCIVITGMFNGIRFSEPPTGNVLIENNLLINIPGNSKQTRIVVGSGTIRNNVESGLGSAGGFSGNNNLTIQRHEAESDFYYEDLFEGGVDGLVLNADFDLETIRPVADSAIDFGTGQGAEARLAELLDEPPPIQEPTMSFSDFMEDAILNMILNGEAITGFCDAAASGNLTNLYVAFYTATPGEDGEPTTNEAAYTGYARVAIARDPDSNKWTVSGGVATPNAAIVGNTSSSESATLTHAAIVTSSSGAGEIVAIGTLSQNIEVTNGGDAPTLTTSTQFTLS